MACRLLRGVIPTILPVPNPLLIDVRDMKLALHWIFSAVVLAAGPAAAQDSLSSDAESSAPESPASTPDVVDKVSVNDVTPDDAIRDRLVEIMEATEWFEDVDVEVRDSVAFLDGTAADEQQKEWAGRLARNTEGVAAVVNRITVKKTVDFSGALQVVTSSVSDLWEDFLARSPLIIAGLLTLFLTAVVSKFVGLVVRRLAERSRLRTSLQDLVLQLITITVWIAGILLSAVIVFPGLTPAKALTVLGLGSVAIGFAFKDIFENFFAGILILWKYPFDRGDFVESGDIHGRIEEITIRTTMIRQVDGQLVVVPNATLFKNPVDVLTNRPSRRTTIMCGVAYDADLDRSRDVITTSIEKCESVRKDQPVEVFAREFGDSSINFELTWWTGAKPLDIRASQDEVVRSVRRGLDEAKIEIPFPQRTLWFPETLRTEKAGGNSGDQAGA